MKLHFANSALVKAPKRVLLPHSRWSETVHLQVRYGILEHPRFGPVLIDTGYDRHVTNEPGRSLGLRAYNAMIRPALRKGGSLRNTLSSLGYELADVRKIIVTHFHADHVSALRCFPEAEIITQKTTLLKILDRCSISNLHRGIFPELLPEDITPRTTDIVKRPVQKAPLNLGDGHDVLGDGSVIAVNLPGHAEGHFGLCFPGFSPALLYGCDVQWMQAALSKSQQLPLLGRLVLDEKRAARGSSQMVSSFRDAGGEVVLCHDPDPTPYDLKCSEDD